jgi:hypothetical protein
MSIIKRFIAWFVAFMAGTKMPSGIDIHVDKAEEQKIFFIPFPRRGTPVDQLNAYDLAYAVDKIYRVGWRQAYSTAITAAERVIGSQSTYSQAEVFQILEAYPKLMPIPCRKG